MNKDQALEELFLTQKPHFDDSDAFMASLAKRLDAVEYIKRHQEASIRRYRMAMVVALVVGLISGAITMAFVLAMPGSVPMFTFNGWQDNYPLLSGLLQWLSENSRMITAALLSVLMSLGVISVVNNLQEINAMRSVMHQLEP